MIHTKKELNRFIKDREKLGIKPGLKRVETLLRLAGNPELNIKAVHVAGTNGKGSVIQFMQTALIKNGYRVGVFTSQSFNGIGGDRKSTRMNSSHVAITYAVICLT